MNVNPNLFFAITIGTVLFFTGRSLSQRVKNTAIKVLLAILFFLLCLPAISFSVYYLHLIGEPLWYVRFRAVDYIELLSACWGILLGFIIGLLPLSARNLKLWPSRLLFILVIVLVFLPFCKPIILPLSVYGPLQDTWKDGVCLQSTGSTCGPASLSSIFASLGIRKTEDEIARGSYTCATGTEIWYLIRYARNNGLHAELRHEPDITKISPPALLGVLYPGGHFTSYLSKSSDKYIIGEPLVKGRIELTETEFWQRYGYHGCAVEFYLP
jgi:hypothetical protein